MPEKVLVAGNNVRNVAESAAKAGYLVFAITKFADADLSIYCREVERVEGESDESDVARKVEEKAEELGAKIVLCSGYELINVRGEMLCNSYKKVEKVANKLKFYRELEKAGLPYPELLGEGERGIVKPVVGGGGEEVMIGEEVPKGFIKQRFIIGTPCSVSVIADGCRAVSADMQLHLRRLEGDGASGFRYSGNLTPLVVDEEIRRELERLAVEAVELFGLVGSVGVDFVLADSPYILEINPRFQGSLDSIEWSCDVNLFRMHVEAFEEKLPERVKREDSGSEPSFSLHRMLGLEKTLLAILFTLMCRVKGRGTAEMTRSFRFSLREKTEKMWRERLWRGEICF